MRNAGESLNPCSNGRCTRTSVYNFRCIIVRFVLILVLMEDALALLELGKNEDVEYVLILVLMEDALALHRKVRGRQVLGGLNPCSNGRCTRTYTC